MRFLSIISSALAAFAGVLAFGGSAHAEPLSLEEILLTLPGTWEIDPAEADEEARGDFRCDASPQVIRIEQTDAGYVYHTEHIGEDDEPRRASIRGMASQNGPAPLILIRYDNEQRRTEDTGEIVEWYLMMPDRNHYYWIRRDWPAKNPNGRTAMRRRCDVAIS